MVGSFCEELKRICVTAGLLTLDYSNLMMIYAAIKKIRREGFHLVLVLLPGLPCVWVLGNQLSDKSFSRLALQVPNGRVELGETLAFVRFDLVPRWVPDYYIKTTIVPQLSFFIVENLWEGQLPAESAQLLTSL